MDTFDPFESLWNNLGEGIQSTPHNDERLRMNTQLATSSTDNIWDFGMTMNMNNMSMDVEPLRVFHPEHQHGNLEHEPEEEDSKRPGYGRAT